jgi:hypothetical protein
MQAVRICDENGNKYTGFELSKNKTLRQIFPDGAQRGLKFKIGKYTYEIIDISIEGFYTTNMPRGEFTLDDENAVLGTHIWIACNENGYDAESFKADLGLI